MRTPNTDMAPVEVDATVEGYFKVKERLKHMRVAFVSSAHSYLASLETNLDREIKESLEKHTFVALQGVMGIKSFGDVEKDSPIARVLLPHAKRLAEEVIGERAKRPLTKAEITNMLSEFSRGYDDTLRRHAYAIGKEVAEKHAAQVRQELFEGVDFIEKIEATILAGNKR